MTTSVDPLRTSGLLRFTTPTLVLLLVGLASGCVDARERPSITGPGDPGGGGSSSSGSINLDVELLAPDTSQDFFVMGREMEIRIRGAEGTGQLEALGYEVRRSGFLRILDHDQASFSATASAQRNFTYVPPDTLPNPTLLLIRGYAVGGPRAERKYTDFVEAQVLFCPENATWC